MSGLSDLSPGSFGMGTGVRGTLVSGTRVQIQDDNSGSGTTPVLTYAAETPRTHPWAMYRTGHIFLWGSNDSPGTGADSSSSDDTHPQASAWFTGNVSSTAHVTATSGGAIQFCCFTATSHKRIFDVTWRIPILSTAAEQFHCRFGYLSQFFGAVTNGAWMEIDSFINGNAQLITSAAGVTTTTDTGVTIVAGQWYRTRIEVTNNTRVDCWVVTENTTLGAPTVTNTTNIPSGTGQGLLPNAMMEKVAGTTSRESDNIYFFCGMDRYAA